MERENRESTRAAGVSRTVLSGEEEEQKRLTESTGLRARDTRAADNQEGESQETPPLPPGLARREQQAPPLPPRETTEYTTPRDKEEATNR